MVAEKDSAAEQRLELLATKVDLLVAKMDRDAAEGSSKDKPKKAWWNIAIEVLGLPAVIVAIWFQFSQTNASLAVPEKTAAETSKLRTEELKTGADLQLQLESLAEKKAQGAASYRLELEQALPKIEATIAKLSQMQKQAERFAVNRAILTYLILWSVFIGIGLFFTIVSQIWSTLITSIRNTANAVYLYKPILGSGDSFDRARKRQDFARKVYPFVDSILYPIPSILDWAVRVSIFVAIVMPFFNELAIHFGSKEAIESLIGSARQLNIGEAIAKLKSIIGSSGTDY